MKVQELLMTQRDNLPVSLVEHPGMKGRVIAHRPKDKTGYRNSHPWEVELEDNRIVSCRAGDIRTYTGIRQKTRV